MWLWLHYQKTHQDEELKHSGLLAAITQPSELKRRGSVLSSLSPLYSLYIFLAYSFSFLPLPSPLLRSYSKSQSAIQPLSYMCVEILYFYLIAVHSSARLAGLLPTLFISSHGWETVEYGEINSSSGRIIISY